MQFGVNVPNYGVHASLETMVRVAEAADELGYDMLWVAERLVVPDPANQGWSKRDPTAYEPLVTLAFLASMTRKVRLGTNILIAPFRNPLVLARQAASLDRLSGGRLILGLGLGWMTEEFQAAGIEFKERGLRTDETIDLLREVWENRRPSYSGRFVQFPPVHFEPKPLQKRIPIWIGGTSDAALRRVVRRGDGWTPTGLSLEQLEERICFIKEEARCRQRGVEEITLCCGCPFEGDGRGVAAMREALETYRGLGISHFRPGFNYETVDELITQMQVFAEEFVRA